MGRNVKKIISEAFNELYNEVASEEIMNPKFKPLADRLFANAKARGGASGLSQATEQSGSEREMVFNYVIDKLIDDYKQTGDPKVKDAIQSAFYPTQGTPMNYRLMKALPGSDRDKLQDSILTAYAEGFVDDFDGMINQYKTGSGKFGGFIYNRLLQRTINSLKGYTGTGGSLDALGGGHSSSMDAPSLDGETTLGDKLANQSAEPSMADRFGGEASQEQTMLMDMLDWLRANTSEQRYVAFTERIKGSSPAEIAEENPELFPGTPSLPPLKQVSKALADLRNSVGPAVSKYISDKYGIEFSFEGINFKALKQVISQKADFSGKGKRKQSRSPEMAAAMKDLNDIFSGMNDNERTAIGVKTAKDFISSHQISSIVDKLKSLGKEELANAVDNAWMEYKNAQNKSSDFGKESDEYVDDAVDAGGYSGIYEGFSMDKLMDRVLKRLSE